MNLKKLLSAVFIFLIAISPLKAKEQIIPKDGFYAGFAYPGGALGYRFEKISTEFRVFTSSDVTVYGPRFSHHIHEFSGGNLYWGTDLFYISDFDGDLTEGDGMMGGVFIGLQKYLGSRFSLTLDSGPYYIDIEDDLSGLNSDGLEFVLNTGVNFHF